VIGSIPVGTTPSGGTYDPANGYTYITNMDSDNVSVIQGTTVIKTIDVGNAPIGAAYDPLNGYVYVGNKNSNNVSVISGLSVVASVSINNVSSPEAVAVNTSTGDVYVADQYYGVAVIRGTSQFGQILLGTFPNSKGATFDSRNGYVYISNQNWNNVSVIRGMSVIASIPVGQVPWREAYDTSTGQVYVVNSNSGNLSVISGLSVVATVPTAGRFAWPYGVAFDSANGYVYVTEGDGNNVSVVNGTSIITSIPVGNVPSAGVYDPADGYVYITNEVSHTVSVLNGSVYYPSVSSVVASPSTVEVGSTTAASTTITVQAKSGEGSLTYSYIGLPPGCATRDTSSLDCTPTQSGTYTIRASVNNSDGFNVSGTTVLVVLPALAASATATPNPGDAAAPVRFVVNPLNGTGVYTYDWQFGDGTASMAQNPSHTYDATGNYTSRVWVNDSEGGSVTHSLLIAVDPELVVGLAVSNATPALGQSIAIYASASGGALPYSYAYSGLPPGCVSVDSRSIGCLPTQSGFYNTSVNVTDGNGVTVAATVAIQVIFEFTVAIPSQVTVNHAFTISVKPQGGFGTLTYAYNGLPPGCASADVAQLSCTPTRVGSYTISISVHDQAQDSGVEQFSLKVVNVGSPTLASYFESPYVLASIAAGAAVIAAATIAYSRRMRPLRPESDLYASYRASPITRTPGEAAPPKSQAPGGARTPSGSPGDTSASDDDTLSDLV
jgi:YVTN family beta-propeller protein